MIEFGIHVLDNHAGGSAEGMPWALSHLVDGGWVELASGMTDARGRGVELAGVDLVPGRYRMRYDIAAYYRAKGVDGTFFPSAHSEFDLRDGERYHVPLLVTPFGHSTYRGD